MIRQRLSVWTSVWPLVFLGYTTNAAAQALFESREILDVTIEAPLTTFSRVRSDVDYLDGTFTFTDEMGAAHSLDLKLRARGRFRREKNTCDFPPVRLNFRKGQVDGTIFAGEDKLKLVTHCQNRSAKNEQFVLREYMAYRILQVLTDYSFRARLLRVSYVDNERNGDTMTKYGFIIEDEDNVGARLGMQSLSVDKLSYGQLDGAQTNLVNLFQFLIGNTDYSLIRGPAGDHCCHNSVPFSDGTKTYPIPYDFDFSGIVDTPYAEPNPILKIRNVRVRRYRGRCSYGGHLNGTIGHFQLKQPEIYGLIDEISYFDRASVQSITAYLDDFYEIISDDKKIDRYLVKGCS